MHISLMRILKSTLFCCIISTIPDDAKSAECVPDDEYLCVLSHASGLASVARYKRSVLHDIAVGCRGRAVSDCIFAGSAFRDAIGDDAQPELAMELLQAACDGGSALGCMELGSIQWAAPDLRVRALENWQRGCELGQDSSCNLEAWAKSQNVGGTPEDAFGIFSQRCQIGDHVACTYLGRMLKIGAGAERNIDRSADVFTNSCEAGYHPSCFELALLYLRNLVPHNHPNEVNPLLAKSCDAGHADSCGLLGRNFIQSAGGKVADQSKRLVQKGCQLGSTASCKYLKDISDIGE